MFNNYAKFLMTPKLIPNNGESHKTGP